MPGTDITLPPDLLQQRGYFVTGAYRLHDKVEVGSYYSNYVANTTLDASLDDNHISTTAITTRVDLTSFWHVKAEGTSSMAMAT